MKRDRQDDDRTLALPRLTEKPLILLHGEIKSPPMSANARAQTGFYLWRLQRGEALAMPISRPMPTVGAGCHELRITDAQYRCQWRVMYCIDRTAILVLDVWKKTTRETPETVKRACMERLIRYRSATEGTIDA